MGLYMGDQQVRQAAESVFKKLQDHNVRGAMAEFQKEINLLERSGSKGSNDEATFLKTLTQMSEAAKQNAALQKLGFPEVHIVQNGEQLNTTFKGTENNQQVEGYVNYGFTQYSRQHKIAGSHELHSEDIKTAEAAGTSSPTNVERTSTGALIGNVKDSHKLETPPEIPAPSYPLPAYVSDNRFDNRLNDNQFKNPDGSWNYGQLAGMGGPLLSGNSRFWRDQFHSSYIDTDIYIPQNALQHIGRDRIDGHLPSGDPINGSIVQYADGPHFVGSTTPFSVGYGKPVRIDARLHY